MTIGWLIPGVVAFGLALGGTSRGAAQDTGQLIQARVHDVSLERNRLGDPADQVVQIYLPPSYQSSPTRRYPVLYLLHGYGGRPEEWTTNGYQGMSLPAVMDSLLRAGLTREMIVVVPNGRNRYMGSFYTNSPITGNWDDFIAKELVAYVDAGYRTIARRESRGIAGHSMGGYGAINLAMSHPDVFGAVYALSPCCLAFLGDLTESNPAWRKVLALRRIDQLPSDPQTIDQFWTDVYVALGAAFAPDSSAQPFFAGYPYRLSGGRLVPNPKAAARWHAKLPLEEIGAHVADLKNLRGLAIDYGENEEFTHIRLGVARFSEALAARGIPHRFEVYPKGNHGSLIRSRFENAVIPFFSRALQGDSSGSVR